MLFPKLSGSDFESISCKENYNYGIIMIIPFMDKYSAKFIIANIFIKNNGNQEKYTIPFRKNAIIFFENKRGIEARLDSS